MAEQTAATEAAAPAAPESKHQMKMRHKAELKALKAVKPKGKGAKKQMRALELEMMERHAQELEALESGSAASAAAAGGDGDGTDPEVGAVTASLQSTSLEEKGNQDDGNRKLSKAQRRKARKAAREAEKQRIAEEEAAKMPDMKEIESARLRERLEPLSLTVGDTASDGHCLFRAISEQLKLRPGSKGAAAAAAGGNPESVPTYMQLRQQAAEFMRSNPDNFLPFAVDPDTGVPLDEAGFAAYTARVAHEDAGGAVMYGGHPEIVALASLLGRTIVVHSAAGEPQAVEGLGPSGSPDENPLQISFHQHYLALGDHYNSILDKQD